MPYKLRTKIWIADPADNVFFGLGRVKILEAIEQHGSIFVQGRLAQPSPKRFFGHPQSPSYAQLRALGRDYLRIQLPQNSVPI